MSDIHHTLLLEVALDLANSVTRADRFDRLLSSIRKVISCDSLALLRLDGQVLVPLATQGLSRDTLGRRFVIAEHPRLAAICAQQTPLRFASDCELADPYDGLLLADDSDLPVHACMGLPLYADQQLLGVLTVDSLQPHDFDAIPERTLALVAALSAATLRTDLQFQQLEAYAERAQGLLQAFSQQSQAEMVGTSPVMRQLSQEIELVAGSDYTVLIEGPTGVGKELVARTLHCKSTRSELPMVQLNCASLPDSLAESELFGHTRGAFSGAEQARQGKFQLADGGTIFLDEVGELSLAIQSKLLRVLQSGEIQPVGQDAPAQVNVRVIAATNRDLKQEVAAGRFREDLYHRLAVYPINVPPLARRQGDILLLAGLFLERTARRLGLRQLKLSALAEPLLLSYPWPGNVRELEHVISRAGLKAYSASNQNGIVAIEPEHLAINQSHSEAAPQPVELEADQGLSLKQATESYQRQLIYQALERHQGNWSGAARELQTDRANLTRLAKRLGIQVLKKVLAKAD